MKPTYLIIFGTTGDLMYKKLLPAICALYKDGNLPENTTILGVGRRDYTTKDLINDAKKNMSNDIDWSIIEPILTYVKLDVNTLEDYNALNERIDEDALKLFYLAVPPTLFPKIAKNIFESGLIEKGNKEHRIVFEKPFGENVTTAKDINKMLWKYFDEAQIYRIDHYLGKEMIQNILIIRFANHIFQQAWNKEAIKSVKIIAKEAHGVMGRGGYYDKVGALKDMLQSHLFQMVALIAMEEPKTYDAKGIGEAKVAVMDKFTFDYDSLVTGQYEGYQKEDHVDNTSQTETFAYIKGFVNTDRWKDVPFHYVTGKKLDEKRSEIIIEFKPATKQADYWPSVKIKNNRLVIKIAPEEGLEFEMNAKSPGLNTSIVPTSLDYCHQCQAFGNLPEAYERLLLELYKGNRTLFAKWDEIETAWKIIDSIIEHLPAPQKYKTTRDLNKHIYPLIGEDIL